MRVWTNARIATMVSLPRSFDIIERGFIVGQGEKIIQIGAMQETDDRILADATEIIDCDGRLITPGLIDCHTHIVWSGSRAAEFEGRLAGESYEQIAARGGGIRSTVASVQETSVEALMQNSLLRVDELLATGVTTLEIKSGYGLDFDNEVKLLEAIREIGCKREVSVHPTYLALHALPMEFASRRDEYVSLVVDDWLPQILRQGLCTAVDGFCEGIAFRTAEIKKLFESARTLGMRVKIHAEQLSRSGGAQLAADFSALSADHLEYTTEEDVLAMASRNVVAVLLPGAFYFLREKQRPPIDLFRKHRVPMAIATDCNPGTSPLTSILLAMNFAATLYRMTVLECWAGVTRNAAQALGILDRAGTIEVGKFCDLAIWNVEHPNELVYRLGSSPLYQRIWRGR